MLVLGNIHGRFDACGMLPLIADRLPGSPWSVALTSNHRRLEVSVITVRAMGKVVRKPLPC